MEEEEEVAVEKVEISTSPIQDTIPMSQGLAAIPKAPWTNGHGIARPCDAPFRTCRNEAGGVLISTSPKGSSKRQQ